MVTKIHFPLNVDSLKLTTQTALYGDGLVFVAGTFDGHDAKSNIAATSLSFGVLPGGNATLDAVELHQSKLILLGLLQLSNKGILNRLRNFSFSSSLLSFYLGAMQYF